MAKSRLDEYLRELIAEASAELPEVSTRYMFGSDAFFADRKIYALVWDGRIALKMSEAERYQALLSLEGSTTWSPMPDRETRPMSGWVLVSEELHDDLDRLRPWVESAHRQAISAKAKPKKKPRPRVRKKLRT